MDFLSQLKRFVHRRLCLDVHGRWTIWGTLASVTDDHVRLRNTVVLSEVEGHSWFDHMQYGEEEGGNRNPETLVRLDAVYHVTCVEEGVPEPTEESAQEEQPSGRKERSHAHECVVSVANGDEDRHASDPNLDTSASALSRALGRLASHFPSSELDTSEPADPSVAHDRVGVHIGIGLIRLADTNKGGKLLDCIHRARKDFAAETGVIVPRIRVRDNLRIDMHAYQFSIDGATVAEGEVMVDRLLALTLDTQSFSGTGIAVRDPAYGLPALWIEPDDREKALLHGTAVCNPESVLVTHLFAVLKKHLHEILSYQDVLHRLRQLRDFYPDTIDDLVPDQVSTGLLHRMLQRLVEEQVPIVDLVRIVESLAYHAPLTPDHEQLLQRVRVDIGRQICKPFITKQRQLPVTEVGDEQEEEIKRILREGGDLTLAEATERRFDWLPKTDQANVLLVQRPELRRPLFEALSHSHPWTSVLATTEIPRDIRVVVRDESESEGFHRYAK